MQRQRVRHFSKNLLYYFTKIHEVHSLHDALPSEKCFNLAASQPGPCFSKCSWCLKIMHTTLELNSHLHDFHGMSSENSSEQLYGFCDMELRTHIFLGPVTLLLPYDQLNSSGHWSYNTSLSSLSSGIFLFCMPFSFC